MPIETEGNVRMASLQRFGLTRRGLLAAAAASGALLGRGAWVPGWAATGGTADPWRLADAIVDHLAWLGDTPERRRRELRQFYVTSFGAAQCQLVEVPLIYTSSTTSGSGLAPAPGSPDNHAAFAAAIAACNRAGGGKVIVPAGDWYCAGPINLLSNVNFHLQSGAEIWFSPNPADYARYGPYNFASNGKLVRSRWQGNDCYNFSLMVYAYAQHNIALTGEDHTSILNGQAGTPYDGISAWWTWKGTVGTAGYVSGEPSEGTANPLNMPLGSLNPSLSAAEINLIEYGTRRAAAATPIPQTAHIFRPYPKRKSRLPSESSASVTNCRLR